MEEKLRDGDLAGTLRTPEGTGPFPAVLALGGSDGGTPDYFLDLLVPAGFACLALTYWGTRETQLAFTEIPLERIERGLRWLASHARAASKSGRVAVIGASRGGELALLAAATFPNLVGPVVAYTPSCVAWAGIDMTLPPGTTRSSWKHKGVPLPYATFPPGAVPAISASGAFSMLAMFEAALRDPDTVARASIAVERANGPVLVVSGGDDGVWPAGRMCEMIVQRMAEHGRARDVEHLHYAQAGHMLFPYSPPTDTLIPAWPIESGGSPDADRAAHRAAWPDVVNTLLS